MSNIIKVALVTDQKYSPLTATAITSIMENISADADVMFYILAYNINKETYDKINSLVINYNCNVEIIIIDDLIIKYGLSNLYPHYYRLLIPYVVPVEVSKIIYLDSDLIVLSDICKLFNVSLGNFSLGASQDYIGSIKDAMSNYEDLGFDGGYMYFNSGVLLIDLRKWRKKKFIQEFISCNEKYKSSLYAKNRYFQYDQYCFNVLFYKDWLLLDSKWNYGAENVYIDDAFIVHFNGHGKPWLDSCQKKYADKFFYYLKKSGYKMSEVQAIHGG